MTAATAELVVGIVTYNSQDDIDTCLEGLQTQTFDSFKVVLLDNASSDDTLAHIADRWPDHDLIRSDKNLGFGSGHNRIIAVTTGQYYMPLNPDAVLTPTYLEEMVKAIESEERVGWVAGKLYFLNSEDAAEKSIYSAGHAVFKDGTAQNIGFGQPDGAHFQHQREVFGANGAAALYRRAMLEELQLTPGEVFDSAIFLYHEDVDLDCRARLLGWRCVFTPDAVGYHAEGRSSGSTVRSIIYALTATRYYSIFKHAFLFDLLTYNIPAFVLHMFLMLLTEPSRGLATMRFIAVRLGNVRRKRKWLIDRRKIDRKNMQDWYDWSARQLTSDSSGFIVGRWKRSTIRRMIGERTFIASLLRGKN